MYRVEYFWKDKLTSLITIDNKKVYVENYTDDWVITAFGKLKNPTLEDYYNFLEDRCFPRDRFNCKELLKSIGLDYYEPLWITQLTHGVIQGDFNWLRFDDQKDITWEKDILPMYDSCK